MGDRPSVLLMLERERWKPSSNGKGMLVAHLSTDEAALLDRDPSARLRMQTWLKSLAQEEHPITGLLMFVASDDRAIRGFIELTVDDRGRFAWNGPSGPFGSLV